MAVLKSPKNVKKKSFWVSKYAQSSTTSFRKIQDRRRVRASHQLMTFLIKSIYWLRTKPLSYQLKKYEALRNRGTRPLRVLTYGSHSFDSSLAHPVILRKNLNSSSSRLRLATVLNADELVF